MPRYQDDVLLGYQPAIEYPNPDHPDTHEQPCTLLFKSVERDGDDDPFHVVRVPCSPEMRVAIAAALMAQDITDQAVDVDGSTDALVAQVAEQVGRCPKCGARDDSDCKFANEVATTGWSDSDFEMMAEHGCLLAIGHIDAEDA